ncbi:MAG: RNA polymerase sigma factor [Verrucomicrobiota bacterium JB022]|nr:RNA polymerase sigma factor [Verrucomicrobiota bacterium JB022]
MEDADQAVLQRLQQADEAALRELIARHQEPVFRLAWRYLGSEQDAAEVAEETFVKVFFNAARYRPKAAVRTWIFSIAANLCRDRLRRRKRWWFHEPLEADEVAPADSGRDAHAETVAREQLAAIDAAVAELPHQLRFPFVFCALEGHSYDACAEVMETTRKSVETRIYRARNILREKLSALRQKS